MGKAIFYIIASGLSFLVVNFFVKILGQGPDSLIFPTTEKIPTHELVFFRSIVSFLISLYFIKKNKLSVLGNNRKWLLIRGFSGMIALTLFFYTIDHLPMAIASTVQYLAPLFTVILAVFIMKESVSKWQWVFIILAFFGAIIMGLSNLVVKDVTVQISWFWLGIGVVSAFFSGLAYNSILKAKETEHTLNIVIYFPMLGIPVMGIWCLFDFVMPHGLSWLYLLVIGVFTQIAQIAMTKAFQIGEASTISPFQFIGSIYALLVGYFIFEEKLTTAVLIGIVLILIGVISNIIVKHRLNKKS